MIATDVHTHGIGGYDSRTSDAGHLLTMARIHGASGVERIVVTVYPAPIKVMRENLAIIKKAMELQADESGVAGKDSERPAQIIGAHLEGPFLNPLRCGSLNAMTLIAATPFSLDSLVEGYEDIIRIMTIAPELDGALPLIRQISERGMIASMGHSDATYSEAEAGHKAGARGITHIFNAMRPMHHREPGIAGFALTNRDIYVEVIADPFHLHRATLDIILSTKPHNRIMIISDSIKETQAIHTQPPFAGIEDSHGRLMGGTLTVCEAAERLSAHYDRQMLDDFISINPSAYLAL